MKRMVLSVLFLCVMVGILAGYGGQPATSAESKYPTKPIIVSCPWGAGGGTDVALRGFLKYMESAIGQPMVVVNKPGASGVRAYAEVKVAAPDGYNLMNATKDFAIFDALGKWETHVTDFKYVCLFNKYTVCIAVRTKNQKYKTLKELIEAAKKAPDKISCGVTAMGGSYQIALLQMEKVAGVKFHAVPYSQGDAQARAGLLGGHIDFLVTSMAAAKPYYKDGSMKILGVFGTTREKDMPDVATLIEQGYDTEFYLWRALAAPLNTPADVMAALEAAAKKAFDNTEYAAWAKKRGVGHSFMSGKDFTAYIKKEVQTIKEATKGMTF